jgi:glycosyltransferase involved in cell wall biosynthesis
MGGALANLYVSTFEGFGIPIIEAFQSQIPVITSNVSSMPEIAANAAMVVDPYETEQITDAMLQLYSSQSLRKDLVAKGIERASEFTWKRTSNLLWSSIIKAAE